MSDQEQAVVETPTVTMAEIEDAATAQGWEPEGELDALTFLKNGRVFRDRLYDEVKALREDNERAYSAVAEAITKQEQRHVQTEKASIEAQIEEAVEAGDTARVKELMLRSQEVVEPVRVVDPNIQFINQWEAENSWMIRDPDINKEVQAFYTVELADNNNINDPRVLLPRVQERIEKLHADRNPANTGNPNARRGAGVEKGGKTKQNGEMGLTMADLTDDEAAHIADFKKLGLSEERMLKSIENLRTQHAR